MYDNFPCDTLEPANSKVTRPFSMTSEPSTTATPPTEQTFVATFRILVLAAAGMAALLAFLPAAGHDQLWFLLMARRWLAGAQLYGPQIFDSNPPLIVWLSALPVVLSQVLHLPTPFVAKLLITLLETAAAFLSLYFLRRARSTRRYELPAIVIFCAVPARDFGQRDHLTAFLILPYVLAAATPQRLTSPRILAGILAATAICLKPHYALIPITLELSLLFLTTRTPSPLNSSNLSPQQLPSSLSSQQDPSPLRNLLRPEPILILTLGLAFLAAIHRFAPLYFTTALPIVRETYWAIGHLTLPQLSLEAIELLILAAISLALNLRVKPTNPTIPLLQLAAFAATLAYFAQGTGWYYQQLPSISLFACALTLQLLDLFAAQSIDLPAWLPKASAALTILALALTTHFTGYPFTPDRAFALTTPDPAFFTALPSGTPVAMLTTSVDAAMMPVERYHLLWSQRTNNLWLLPSILRSESPLSHPHLTPYQTGQLDDLQHRWMVEDLNRWHPQLILIQRCQDPTVHCQELEDRHDDLLAWFNRDPAFRTLFSHYTPAPARGEFNAYTLNP
jgi:hypothetical protein